MKNIIPEEMVRGLRFKSFGSLVKSASKLKYEDMLVEHLRQILITTGAEIESEILEYRDKIIEHPGNMNRGTLFTSDGTTRILHQKNNDWVTNKYHNGLQVNKRKIMLNCIFIKHNGDEESFYYHIKPDVRIGQYVDTTQKLGETYDSSGIHFATYGPHNHVFTSSGINLKPEDLFGEKERQAFYSPSPSEALRKLGLMIEDILNCLIKILDEYGTTSHNHVLPQGRD